MTNSSLSGHAGFVAVFYVVLSAIAVVVVDLRIVLIPTACVVLALVIGGFVVFRPLRIGVVLPWPAAPDSENELGVIVVNGQPCPFEGYEQDLLVEVQPRRMTQLLVCSLLAGAALFFMLPTRGTSESSIQIGPFEAEIICIAGLMVLLRSLRWFAERRFLGVSRIAFGSMLGIDPGFFRRGITYQFFDKQGERRGGTGPLSNQNDNAVLVLYQSTNADVNTVHSAFVFHNFRIGLLPGRRKVSVETGAQN